MTTDNLEKNIQDGESDKSVVKSTKSDSTKKTDKKDQTEAVSKVFKKKDEPKSSVVEFFDLNEAVSEIKKQARVKFVESFDVVFKLGIDPKQSTQQIRGFTILDHDYPRNIRVAVLVESDQEAEAAKTAGADRVGYYDLVEDIQAGKLNFDVVVTKPDNVHMLAKFGKILGPKGLMPNPKLGTVTTDLVQAVKNIKSRQVNFKSDRFGLVHTSVGKVDFQDQILIDNVNNLARTLMKNRPSDAKGTFLRRLWCNSTMGKSFRINLNSLKLA